LEADRRSKRRDSRGEAGKRVAMVDRNEWSAAFGIHGGTVPSKTLREAILHLTGFRHRSFYWSDYVVKDRISIRDLAARVSQVVERETGSCRDQCAVIGIICFAAPPNSWDANTIEVQGPTEAHMLHATTF